MPLATTHHTVDAKADYESTVDTLSRIQRLLHSNTLSPIQTLQTCAESLLKALSPLDVLLYPAIDRMVFIGNNHLALAPGIIVAKKRFHFFPASRALFEFVSFKALRLPFTIAVLLCKTNNVPVEFIKKYHFSLSFLFDFFCSYSRLILFAITLYINHIFEMKR